MKRKDLKPGTVFQYVNHLRGNKYSVRTEDGSRYSQHKDTPVQYRVVGDSSGRGCYPEDDVIILWAPAVLRKDLKPGTVFRYNYATQGLGTLLFVVGERHPDCPLVHLHTSAPGVGDLEREVYVEWLPAATDGYSNAERGEAYAKQPLLTTDKKARKEMPIARGFLDYFPKAAAAVAHVSFVANEQHNPGEPMHWSKGKSNDHADCIGRHLIERGGVDDDGLRHSAKLAWRAMALLEEELDAAASSSKV